MSDFPITSTAGAEMLLFLPKYYEHSLVIRSIMEAEGIEFDKLMAAVNETLDQFFVGTATWGLDRWETELGLPVAPAQPDNERREKIISRLRGYGTCTLKLAKTVAESYDQGAIDVVEDFAGYAITIRFVDTTGVPPNLDDMKKALRAVVPAHLNISYEYNYLVWSELDTQGWTWSAFDLLALTWQELEVYA